MSERANFDTTVPSFTQESKGNGCSGPYSTTNGRSNNGASGVIEDTSRIRDTDGDEGTISEYSRDDALRAYRNIFARYDWFRLETSLSQQQQGFEAFSGSTGNRAVFESREPTKVIIAFVPMQVKA